MCCVAKLRGGGANTVNRFLPRVMRKVSSRSLERMRAMQSELNHAFPELAAEDVDSPISSGAPVISSALQRKPHTLSGRSMERMQALQSELASFRHTLPSSQPRSPVLRQFGQQSSPRQSPLLSSSPPHKPFSSPPQLASPMSSATAELFDARRRLLERHAPRPKPRPQSARSFGGRTGSTRARHSWVQPQQVPLSRKRSSASSSRPWIPPGVPLDLSFTPSSWHRAVRQQAGPSPGCLFS